MVPTQGSTSRRSRRARRMQMALAMSIYLARCAGYISVRVVRNAFFWWLRELLEPHVIAWLTGAL